MLIAHSCYIFHVDYSPNIQASGMIVELYSDHSPSDMLLAPENAGPMMLMN